MLQLKALGTFVLLLVLTGCESSVLDANLREGFSEDVDTVNLSTVKKDISMNDDLDAENLVITDAGEFGEFWSDLHSNRSTEPGIPDIDFENEIIIVSVMGTKPTTGYKIEINKAGAVDGQMGINVELSSPGKGCLTGQALTNPYHIVKMEKSNLPIAFFEEEITMECIE
ncbi:MAG: protease complex subunit PrcB family protein [Balneolales bacterium]